MHTILRRYLEVLNEMIPHEIYSISVASYYKDIVYVVESKLTEEEIKIFS